MKVFMCEILPLKGHNREIYFLSPLHLGETMLLDLTSEFRAQVSVYNFMS